MKKFLLFVTIALFFLSAQALAVSGTLTGMIADITQDGYALWSEEGIRFAVISRQTALETDTEPAIGDMVTVTYSGATDRKTVNTDSLTMHMLTGTVTEITEGEEPCFLLSPADGSETVRVNLPDIRPDQIAAGIPVTVYYSGAITRSIPPQITAQYVRGLVLTGTIAETREDGSFLLTTQDGETVLVHTAAETPVLTELAEGKRVRVSVTPQVRLSLPAQYEAVDILPGE